MPEDFAVTELWQVLRGEQAGRQRDDEITVFDSVGFALEDYTALRYMHALARQHQLLQPLALLPQLSNPKNLFELLLPPAIHDEPAPAEADRHAIPA